MSSTHNGVRAFGGSVIGVIFNCHICKTMLQAEDAHAGQLVRCPTCLTAVRVPPVEPAELARPEKPADFSRATSRAHDPPGTMRAQQPSSASERSSGGASMATAPTATVETPRAPQRRVTIPAHFRAPGGGKRYGFNCGHCSSRLEATESMAAQEGQCPTCGNTIVIPILDRYGRLIDPITQQIIKQDPHPVHAYAAAGERAPRILRMKNGSQIIQCPRCQGQSAITSNNCKSCGMPFTMEGTTLEATGASNGFCVAALVLGIIGIPAGCTGIVPLLAIIFGVIGYNQVTRTGSEGGGRGMAIAGIICGIIGLLFFGYIITH